MDAIAAYSSRQVWTTEEIGQLETARNIEKNVMDVQSGAKPALNVILSPESIEYSANFNAAVFAQQIEGTSSDGTAVNVQRVAGIYSAKPDVQDSYINTEALEGYIYAADFTDSEGNSINVEFTGDIKSSKNAEGNLSVYFYNSDSTRTYSADGGYVEQTGYLLADDADSTIISTSGSQITAGNGNNLIFVYGDNSSIQGGEGNDDIRLASGLSNVNIDTGAGNNSVSITTAYNGIDGATAYNMNLTLNDGNNTVSIGGMNGRGSVVGGSITAGNGDNSLNIREASGTVISLGDGDNHYKGGTLKNDASLTMGDGANTVDIYEVGQSDFFRRAGSSATVSVGNGDNQIKIYEIENASAVTAGNGANTFDVHEVEDYSALNVGNGGNMLDIGSVAHNSNVNVGNGDNKIYIYEIDNESNVDLGNGSNLAKIYGVENNSSLGFGDGNNALQLYSLDNSMINFGNGDNDIKMYEIRGKSTLETGDGSNIIQAESVKDESKITSGEGENTFYMSEFSVTSSIFNNSDNTFINGDINNLKTQGLLSLMNDLTNVRGERKQQGIATVTDIEADEFFNAGFGDDRVSIESLNIPSKAEVAATRSYMKAAITGSVHLTHSVLPETISRYINNPALLDGASPYHWYDPANA